MREARFDLMFVLADFARQLTEARSNLDQLEGFQNQELSKVRK